MLRINKTTDYAINLLCLLDSQQHNNTSYLSERSGISEANVSKILKILTVNGILCTKRGINGGYALAKPANEIKLTDVIHAFEGPIAITTCNLPNTKYCSLSSKCKTKSYWQFINLKILDLLNNINIENLKN